MIKKSSCKIFVSLKDFVKTQPSCTGDNSKLKSMNGDKGDEVWKFRYHFHLRSSLGHLFSEGNKLNLIYLNFKETHFITVEKPTIIKY